ncbi:sterile alpha motif domain-containing protein 9-like [Spinachia spinachia]
MEWTQQQILSYVRVQPDATNTRLFSFLALFNTYHTESFLPMSKCQQILGPPDPIHGGPPFETRMEPFDTVIKVSDQRCSMDQEDARLSVELLDSVGISRSTTVKNLMISLCGDQPQAQMLRFIRDLLTKREVVDSGRQGKKKENFSRLIEDISKENFHYAVSVLKTASDILRQNHIYPQTLSRLYYIRGGTGKFNQAEKWAKTAIERAPNNSFVADTLGQVYKNRLTKEARYRPLEATVRMANKALEAFEDVERKAESEEGQEMVEMAGTINISKTFNNRGLYGFIKVAKIFLENLPPTERRRYAQNVEMKVRAEFDFFERYLTYSQLDQTSTEPHYFWKDIVRCYEMCTTQRVAESATFAGLLRAQNRRLFTSMERWASFAEAEQTVSDLERIQDELRAAHEADPDNVPAAQSYILSNILLGNAMHDSPKLTCVSELQAITRRLLDTPNKTPELHLLAVLLFWPEEERKTDEPPESCTSAGPELHSVEFVFNLDVQRYVTLMEKAYMTSDAKYHRGRCLLPQFFLGKGPGLSRWIHKSRLDKIVENEVNKELAESVESAHEKWERFNKKWISGDVWRLLEIQHMLLPIQLKLPNSPTMPQKQEKEEVYAQGTKITAETTPGPYSALSTQLFYLCFTIQGPVVFQVRQ